MNDDALRETYLRGEDLYNGKIIKVEKWTVALPNGKEAFREVVRHNGAVAVVPVDAEGRVTLVRQHRIAAGRFTWEIPAGKLDTPQENHLEAAKRELEEETGLNAENWRFLTLMDSSPGFCTEKIAIYVATGLSQHPAHPDSDEFLHLKKMPLSEAVEKVMAGQLRDSKTALGLLMAARVLTQADYAPLSTSIQRPTLAPSSPVCHES